MRPRWNQIGSGVAIVIVAALAMPGRAHADDALVWKPAWPRFRWSEGLATVGLLSAAYAEDHALEGPSSARWTGGILFDSPARALLRGRSTHVQTVATRYADIGYRTLSFFPYFDAALALGVHRSPDVALQMFLIDVESFAFTAGLTNLTKLFAARQRPYARDCSTNGTVGIHGCGTSYDNIGFFSGHTSASFTGAALTCVHHQHLPLYGGALPDGWACVWAVAGASATGLMRMVSDDHYASDVMVGAAAGFVSGYVLPSLLHYGFGAGRPATARPGVAPVIMSIGDGVGAGMAGPF